MIRPLAPFTVRPRTSQSVKAAFDPAKEAERRALGAKLKGERLGLRIAEKKMAPKLKVIGRPGKTRACSR